MQSKGPDVSVVMSVYNERPYVGEAVESVLAQTYTDFEFIIIDDGSTDGTRTVLRKYAEQDARIRLIEQPNRGLIASLNRGLAAARGPYIARMDGDDICLPERFQVQVAFLEQHPDHVVVGSVVDLINEDGDPITPDHPAYRQRKLQHMDLQCSHEAIEGRLLNGGWTVIHPAIMMRRGAVNRIGGYDPIMKDAEDRDLFLRLAEVGRIRNLQQVLLKYRVHGDQVSTASAVQQYWSKRARRAAHQRRGLPLPPALRFWPMVRSAIGKELRQTALWLAIQRAIRFVYGSGASSMG